MNKRISLRTILIILVSFFAVSTLSYADKSRDYYQQSIYQNSAAPSGGAMFIDAIFARPLGIVATVVGTAVYTVSLPFSLTGGNEDEARENLVYAPAEFTFQRPLGEFNTPVN